MMLSICARTTNAASSLRPFPFPLQSSELSVAALPLVSRFAYAADRSAGNAASSVQEFNEVMLGVMKAGQRAPFAQRFAMLAPAVDRTFDLDAVLRLSVGPHWASMS